MPPNSERGILSLTTSMDDWLDQKKKQDGAEGLWRIGDKLYDFTLWARTHPGGQFWINTTRGTDITEAFESHHFSTKAKSLLHNFYRKDASSPRYFFTTFSENGFYNKFKHRVLQQYPVTDSKPSLKSQLLSINDGLAAAVFLTGLLGTTYGIIWNIASGILLGLLTICSHSFLHMKDNWRVYYFNMSLMSSREWRIRHVLSHHQYRGTTSDLEIPVWQPFLKTHEGLPTGLLNFLLFPIVAHFQFIQRCVDVLLSKKLAFHSEELVSLSLALFLYLFGGSRPWETFIIWNQIILIGSFVYCLFSSVTAMSHLQTNWDPDKKGNDADFGIVQLSLSKNHPEDESVFSILNSFRGNVLHYLCPSVKCGSLSKFIPALDEMSDEFKTSLPKASKKFPEGVQNAIPEGHVFFS